MLLSGIGNSYQAALDQFAIPRFRLDAEIAAARESGGNEDATGACEGAEDNT